MPVDYRASPDLLLRVQAIAKAKLLLAGDEVRYLPNRHARLAAS